MYFDSLLSLWQMDGHGFYVWLAYGVSVGCILWLCVATRVKQNKLLNTLRLKKK